MRARFSRGLPATLALALLLVVAAVAWRGLQLGPPSPNAAQIGAAFPSFRLRRLDDGAWLGVADLPRRMFALNVWASWCPTCVVEHPLLNALGEEGVTLVGLNYHDDRERALAWLAARGDPMRFHIADPKGKLATALGVTGAPETFIVGADRVVLARHLGELDRHAWRRLLASAQARERARAQERERAR